MIDNPVSGVIVIPVSWTCFVKKKKKKSSRKQTGRLNKTMAEKLKSTQKDKQAEERMGRERNGHTDVCFISKRDEGVKPWPNLGNRYVTYFMKRHMHVIP